MHNWNCRISYTSKDGNHIIISVPVKQPWRIQTSISHRDPLTTMIWTKQNKHCVYFKNWEMAQYTRNIIRYANRRFPTMQTKDNYGLELLWYSWVVWPQGNIPGAMNRIYWRGLYVVQKVQLWTQNAMFPKDFVFDLYYFVFCLDFVTGQFYPKPPV